jgi:hypothetical protein
MFLICGFAFSSAIWLTISALAIHVKGRTSTTERLPATAKIHAIRLNQIALSYAKELIEQGHLEADGKDAWRRHRPSAAEENEFIRLHGFSEYAKWHLGIDDAHAEDTKARYKFPCGDFKNVHRCGVLAARSRAGQYKDYEIENAAAQLKAMIDPTKERLGRTLERSGFFDRRLFRCPGGQEGVNELREFITVSAFENGRRRHVDLMQPFSEFRKILLFECHLDQRIARVSVESGRDEQNIRMECEEFLEGVFGHIGMLGARRVRCHGIIVDVRERFCAGSGVGRKLMNGRKRDSRIVRDNRFRAVAVVGVKIPDRDTFSTIF